MSSHQVRLWCPQGFVSFLFILTGCRTTDDRESAAYSPAETPSLRFEDVTVQAGLASFRHENGAAGDRLFPETMSGAVAIIDFDADAWPDVLLAGGGVWTAPSDVRAVWLYRNQRDGTFLDVTASAGLADARAYGMGLAVADYDGDGDEDFYLTTTRENLLFRNDGGRFNEVAEKAGVAGEVEWSSSALFFDADRDGRQDLFVGNYVEWSPETDRWCMAGNVKSYCTPEVYRPARSRFYKNEGERFTDRTEEAGFFLSRGKTLGVAAADIDGDQWVDLILANDTEPDEYFRNRGDGSFEEIGVTSGMALDERGQARAGMGIDVGVVDALGTPTIFVGNFSNEMVGVYRYGRDGVFVDRAAVSRVGGVTRRTLAFGLFLFDAELDGDLDLFVSNGHIIPEVDDVDDDIRYRQPPHLFLNDGNGRFEDAAPAMGGPLLKALVGRGTVFADYDRDGDLDIFIVENGGPVKLLQNQIRRQDGGPHSLRVRLKGRPPATSALGARVRVYADGRMHAAAVKSGSSYLSQSELPLTFGLGRTDAADSLVVEWPSGLVQRLGVIAADGELVLQEGGVPEREGLTGVVRRVSIK